MIDVKSDSEINRIQEELQKKGVKYCMGTYVDIHGIPKGKVVPISHLHHMAHGSELYTGYALDGLGQAPNIDCHCHVLEQGRHMYSMFCTRQS